MAKDNNSYFVMMGILSNGEKSGYDIKKTIEHSIGYFYKVSNGQIYPVLQRLEKEKLATAVIKSEDKKPHRKVYTITEKGKEIFADWLLAPVNSHNPRGNEFLLKLYFGAAASIEHNQTIIKNAMESRLKNLDIYKKIAEKADIQKAKSEKAFYSLLTLRHGQLIEGAFVQWAAEALALLEKLERKEFDFQNKTGDQ